MYTQQQTREWYRTYYRRKGQYRNDVLRDAGVLFQQLGFDVSVTKSLQMAELDRASTRILDVGCGGGGSVPRFLQMGFRPENLYGIDILEERVAEGRRRFPNVHITCGNAESMPYDDGFFDLVMESTMFVQITDPRLARNVASDMLRVTKVGGYLLLIDWRYSKPGNTDYLGLSKRRIKELFDVGSQSRIVCQSNGALIPPVGRSLSKYAPSMYFLIAATIPLLVGQQCTLLQKRPS